jgi:shikimate dehydrogenase
MMIDSQTQLCMSLAERPGSFGNRFHNYLYGELHLNFAYRSGTTPDLKAALAGMKGLRIRGCGLSMPHKEQAIALLDDLGDEVDPVARKIGAINTVVNEDVAGAGHLKGYNTDWIAVRELLCARNPHRDAPVLLAGSGGMARACAYALSDLGFKRVRILARNEKTAQALAAIYGFEWSTHAPVGQRYEVLINATPVGMTPDPPERIPFAPALLESARLVMESVAYPPETTLLRQAKDRGLIAVSGFDITLTQAVEQFRLYTGVSLRVDQIGRAAVYARGISKVPQP